MSYANDKILLDKMLTQGNAEEAPHLKADKYFEFFACDQILKDHDLTPEEVLSGIVDGGGDGGLDAVYVFLNDRLLREDDTTEGVRKNALVELVCIQAKNEQGFGETAIDKMRASAEDFLNLSTELTALKSVYNSSLLKAVHRFRQVYEDLASRLPRLSIAYYYTCKGEDAHDNVRRKVEGLRSAVQDLFSDVRFSFSFVGATELVAKARVMPRASRSLVLDTAPMQPKDAFICLARLSDLFDFITDQGKLARHIFDANVRDHQGKTEVNSDIRKTLTEPHLKEDFWWLNNGVTVLGDSAQWNGKALIIENPQLVNGVQTSTEIFNYLSGLQGAKDERLLLIRVLVPSSEASQDRIIKATNSQNAVAAATLRSTEKIHRDIEQYFRSQDLYYDRRKNFYRNSGKPLAKIIAIPYLAQAVMSVALRRPGDARARPSTLLKSDDQYARIFSESYPLELYLICALLTKRVDEFLYSKSDLDRKDLTNLRWYVCMLASMELTGKPQPKAQQIAEMNLGSATADLLEKVYFEAQTEYKRLGGTDLVAKSLELGKNLITSRTEAFLKSKTKYKKQAQV